jgi:hypothetical protein
MPQFKSDEEARRARAMLPTLKEPEGCKASSFNQTGHPTRLLNEFDFIRGVLRNSPFSRPCDDLENWSHKSITSRGEGIQGVRADLTPEFSTVFVFFNQT